MTDKPVKQEESVESFNNRQKQDSGHPIADRVYYWFIDLYTKRKKRFEWSDALVFKFWAYAFPTIAGYILFFVLFLWLGTIWIKKYGEIQTVIIFMMLLMWRLQVLIGIQSQMNKKF